MSGRARKPRVAVRTRGIGLRSRSRLQRCARWPMRSSRRSATNLAALLWHGSWARGEQTPESDHDMIVVLKRNNWTMRCYAHADGVRRAARMVDVRQDGGGAAAVPADGRLQFHYGISAAVRRFRRAALCHARGFSRTCVRSAADIAHECAVPADARRAGRSTLDLRAGIRPRRETRADPVLPGEAGGPGDEGAGAHCGAIRILRPARSCGDASRTRTSWR